MISETIAVVAFNGISPFHLSIPHAIFGEDRTAAGVPPFTVVTCAAEKGRLTTTAGYTLGRMRSLREIEGAGIVVVSSWRDPDEVPPQPLLKALKKAYQRGATVVGLCLGSYVLAAAGLLDGRQATTHWAWAAHFAERFPLVQVDPDVLYLDDGKIITSAGGAAGIDCCLHLLRKLHGAEVAGRVARRMVVPPHRQGGQAQYIEQPVPSSMEPDRLALALEWAQQNLHHSQTIDDLATRAFMSRRTFTRRFRQATGTAFGAWLLNQRLALAQRLLERTTKPIGIIAEEAGFGSEVSLRQQFGKVLKISPARYRKEFAGR
jgi:transcriptional regulator GlxA family with amidase domain